MMNEEFNFAVGKPWDPAKPDGHVGFYSYGGTNQFGTMKSAEVFRDYCNAQEARDLRREGKVDEHGEVINPRGLYRIYKLVKITQ
jgi:hypothetical protein